MTTLQNHPTKTFSQKLSIWLNRRLLWLSKHWLAVANVFFFTYFGLPILAPILMAAGFTGAANTIYQVYNMVCHQLPTRTYFIFGEQVAMCQRCLAIYVTFFIGGLVFNFARYRALPFKWYILFTLPMALDGGSAFVSELAQVIPLYIFWIIGLTAMGFTWLVLYKQQVLVWQVYVIFAGGIVALLYLQFVGLRISNIYMRNITGMIFGTGTVWFAYPTLAEGFKETARDISRQLAKNGHP